MSPHERWGLPCLPMKGGGCHVSPRKVEFVMSPHEKRGLLCLPMKGGVCYVSHEKNEHFLCLPMKSGGCYVSHDKWGLFSLPMKSGGYVSHDKWGLFNLPMKSGGCFHSHISTQTFRRALTGSVDSCAEIKSAPSVA